MSAKGALPPVTILRQSRTHRLVSSKYAPRSASVLARIADDDAHLREIFDLDHATNERLLAEKGLLPGIGAHELVYGIPNFRVVNAAFCHAHPLGSRFSGPERGTWYAAFALGTAQAEVAFHKTVEYAEIGRFDDTVTYDDYLADFQGGFHDIRDAVSFRDCLDPNSYAASQALAGRLLEAGSAGIVYPSVRQRGGVCLSCFRPALVGNVRRGRVYRFAWEGNPVPRISVVAGDN